MEQNRTVEHLRGMWLRLKRLASRPDRRSSIALATGSAAVLLIVGGIAFAGQGPQGTQAIDQAASLFHPSTATTLIASPSQASNGSTVVNPELPNANNTSVGGSADKNLPSPTTIIGPHGEKIVVPPNTVKSGATPGTTLPSLPGSTPTTQPQQSTVVTPSTQPASVTTTTTVVRSVPTNGSNVPTASINVMNSSPEDPNVGLKVTGADSDGFVSSISVDWNDGSAASMYSYNLSACVDPPSTQHTEVPSHNYSVAGSYNIAVTVTSVSCTGDSSTAQNAFSYASVVTGGTQTPPVTTVGAPGASS